MRCAALVIALVAIMAAGCATTERSYQTSTTVAPAGPAHVYTVEFKIWQTGKDGEQTLLGAPMITLKAGEKARISMHDKKKESGIFCTALVTETESGLEALTTVIVKEEGTETLNTSQTQTMVARK